jgi:hypothetical protein
LSGVEFDKMIYNNYDEIMKMLDWISKILNDLDLSSYLFN